MHATNETRGAMTGAGGDHARARRALAVDGGPQGPRGPVGPAPGDVGSATPARQPHGVLRRRDGGRVRGGPPADPCVAVDRARRAGRGGGSARRRPAVAVVSAAVALGFASVPIAVLAGWLR